LVVALGGHAIVPHGAAGTAEQQVAGPRQRWLDGVGTAELRELAAKGTFGVGSMAPKVEAALRFVDATGQQATIGPLERAADVLHGRSGTRVTRSGATVGAGR
jgi:carbamate kinase